MKIHFVKYQGTGNDFIAIDGREHPFDPKNGLPAKMCDRRFGIGADGIIVVSEHNEYDFHLDYYNPDGSSSLCGNGTRCAIHFAQSLGMLKGGNTTFMAFDGVHEGEILPDGLIKLKMNDVGEVRNISDGDFADTGSPHLVRMVDDLENTDVMGIGRDLRYNAPIDGGTNVNFVERKREGEISVRTYERGVENETLSCGTGVTACAIIAGGNNGPVKINTRGGGLQVDFKKLPDNTYSEIFLTGPAAAVFEGTYTING